MIKLIKESEILHIFIDVLNSTIVYRFGILLIGFYKKGR